MQLSTEEYAQCLLSEKTLDRIVDQMKVNGYVVIERLFDEETIHHWHQAYHQLFDPFVQKAAPENTNGHYRMDLPFTSPFVDENLVTHPIVMQIMEAMLGRDCICQYLASNTCVPGSGYQDIHSDLGPLYPESDVSLPPVAIVLNIALVDFRADNGPTEIWPGGTHLIPEKLNRPERIQEAAKEMQSIHIEMPAGSIALRDLRMWHRGTPNRSSEPRPMIALVYFRHWFGAQPLRIAKSTYDQFSERVQHLFRKANLLDS